MDEQNLEQFRGKHCKVKMRNNPTFYYGIVDEIDYKERRILLSSGKYGYSLISFDELLLLAYSQEENEKRKF